MSKDVYVLEKAVDEETINEFNHGYRSYANKLFYVLDGNHDASEMQIDDWIAALKSGKKIVNPLSLMGKQSQEAESDRR